MPLSDLYVAQYLLDATLRAEGPLEWQAEESGGYRTHVNGVRLSLFHARTVGWTGLCLQFSRGDEVALVEEPRPVALFGRRFRDDDDQRLSEAMQRLARVVAEQCRKRRMRAWDLRESIRENLFRRVLFPDADQH